MEGAKSTIDALNIYHAKCNQNVLKMSLEKNALNIYFSLAFLQKNTVRLAIPKSAAVSSNGECYLAFGKVNKAKKVHCF